MLWDEMPEIWEAWDDAKMDELDGDQNFITQVAYPDHLNLLPDGVALS